MRTKKQKKKELSDEQLEIMDTKDFFDRTVPGVIRFYTPLHLWKLLQVLLGCD